nr:hypothetical protein [Piscicoccus intestinalis]
MTSVVFPEPDTPVTAVNTSSGSRRSSPRTVRMVIASTASIPAAARASDALRGTGGGRRRYSPVTDSGTWDSPGTGPEYSTSPPSLPAPGPTSMTQSARRTSERSCSTMSTLLPSAMDRSNSCASIGFSDGWSPADGSSST